MYIHKFQKIVIKIGSSILVDNKGKPKKKWLEEFAKDIKYLLNLVRVITLLHQSQISFCFLSQQQG